MTALAQSARMTQRHLRGLARQPWLIGISLVQPVIWLLLFGALFRRVVEIPGFGAGNYLTFLTPGIVVLSAIFGGGWSGMSIVTDIDQGVMDRFLVTPLRRGALMAGLLGYQAVTIVVQTLIIVAIGLASGARFSHASIGLPVLVVGAILLAVGFAALSNALALLLRKEESVIAAVQFVALPLTFLSSGLMSQSLAAHWVSDVARVNPVNWAVVAAREALSAGPDWGSVVSHLGYLVVFALVCGWLSTRAFGSYQRSA
ncbi:MAG TPA: ABC transporter permease [Mycobacteriales bacterium]|nr:ABC transporter permease [Mycobacteriales bacterium]